MRLRRDIVAGAAALAIVGAGLGVRPTSAKASTSCGASSTLLGDYAQYFTFNGFTNGALYQIELRGTWSKKNKANDCIWGRVTYTAQASLFFDVDGTAYPAAGLSGTIWYSPSFGVWDADPYSVESLSQSWYGVSNNSSEPGPEDPSVLQVQGQMIAGPPSWSGDCIVMNPEGNVGPPYTQDSYFADASGNTYTAGSNVPGNNTTLICPS